MLAEDYAKDLSARLHAALDELALPDRGWPAARADLAARLRRRRTRAAVVAAVAAATAVAMVVAVGGAGAGHRVRRDRADAAALLRYAKTASAALGGDFASPSLAYGDGRLFAVTNQGRLLRLDPVSLKITGRLFVGRPAAAYAPPVPVTYGDHAVWVLALSRRQLWRIDPASLRVTLRLPVGQASGLAYGGGSVWLTSCCAPTGGGAVLLLDRIDPVTGRRTGLARLPGDGRHGWGAGAPASAPLPQVVLAAGRVILVAGPNAPVFAVSPSTVSVLRSFRVGCDGCEGPIGVAVGPRGLYAVSIDEVLRLDLRTGQAAAEGPPDGRGVSPESPAPIVAGPSGVWLLPEGKGGCVPYCYPAAVLLDPRTLTIAYRTNVIASGSVLAVGAVVYATRVGGGVVRYQRVTRQPAPAP